MYNLFLHYVKKLLPHVINEANINLGYLILIAFISGCFLLLRLYRTKMRMKAAENLVKAASETGMENFAYRDGLMRINVTFKRKKNSNNNEEGDNHLRKVD